MFNFFIIIKQVTMEDSQNPPILLKVGLKEQIFLAS